MKRGIIGLGVGIAMLAGTGTATGVRAAQAALSAQLEYHVFFAGLKVVRADAALSLEGERYVMRFAGASEGVLDLLYSWRTSADTHGVVDGVRLQPRQHSFERRRGDRVRSVALTYDAVGAPVLTETGPPGRNDDQRVPPEMRVGTVDYLSMMGTLVARLAAGAGCAHSFALFKGWRRFDAVLTDAPATVTGPACRFVMNRLLAPGAKPERPSSAAWAHGDDGEDPSEAVQEPTSGTIFFAPAWSGGPLVPARVEIDGWFGAASVRLVSACPATEPVSAVREARAANPKTCG